MMDVSKLKERILGGGEVTEPEALWLLGEVPKDELHEASCEITRKLSSRSFDFCAIVSARQGRCGEDCKWCAQSAHWKTQCERHGWIGTEKCVEAAKAAEEKGVRRFAIVTSGRGQTDEETDEVCAALRAMASKTSLDLCASLGLVTRAQLERLRAAGLKRIHCNLETAPSRFGSLCTTHSAADKLATLRAAKELGFEICCGGIVGMGETDREFVEFAFAVKGIGPDSIPLNILHPIPGTPLESAGRLDFGRLLDMISVLRFVNPRPSIRFAGGRRSLSDDEARLAIRAGVNAGIAGHLLTTPGAVYDDDRALAAEAGLEVAPAAPDISSNAAQSPF